MTKNKTKIPLKFKIKINTTSKNENPCLILLHGYGSNEDDLFSLADYFPDDYIIISLRAPIALPMGGYAWSNINSNLINEYTILQEAKNSIKLIYESIQILTDKYNINKKDVSLIGFSQGCILSWALLVNYPKIIRRAVTLSGYIIPELINLPLDKIFNLLVFNSHGVLDEMIPVSKARDSLNLIKENNPNIVYKEDNQGHGINQENLNDLLEWIKVTSLKGI